MVFVKHKSLKSDTFFNPIFIPDFSGSRFFRVQIQGPVQILEVAQWFMLNLVYQHPYKLPYQDLKDFE